MFPTPNRTPAHILAAAGLLAPVMEQWPELKPLLPTAVRERLAAPAINWAVKLAAGHPQTAVTPDN